MKAIREMHAAIKILTGDHAEKRRRVMDTAFREWSKNHFVKTSLSAVASELQITKAALYRYFVNKEELLEAMTGLFLAEINAVYEKCLAGAKQSSLKETVTRYYTVLYAFFTDRPAYLSFLLFHLLKRITGNVTRLIPARAAMDEFLLVGLAEVSPDLSPALRAGSVRFIHVNGLFWLIQLFRNRKEKNSPSVLLDFTQALTDNQVGDYIDTAVRSCLSGYFKALNGSPDHAGIEKASWIKPEEMLKKDRIFTAIEEVIDEEGYAEASLEKIAERIGINKSSLYFYFKNRNDLLLKTLVREQEYFLSLAGARLRRFDSFPEKLYSLFVVILSFMFNKPDIMTVLHWTRYRNIGITLPREKLLSSYKRFSLLGDAADRASQRVEQENPEILFMFMVFFLINEIHFLSVKTGGEKNLLPVIRELFGLYCRGVGGESKR